AGAGLIESVQFAHNFIGGGPTASAQAHWRLGGSNVALYGMARGSVLVGPSRQTFVSLGGGGHTDLAQSTQRDTIPVGELELGLEYAPRGGSGFFVQTAVVDQTYWNLGSASNPSGNLSLFGFQISVGLGY